MGKRWDRIMHGWNAFTDRSTEDRDERRFADPFGAPVIYGGGSPSRLKMRITNERSIITSIYNRLAVDASGVPFKHVRLDENDRISEEMSSGLNDCLNVDANLDQAGRAFRHDIFSTLFDRGVIAIVPTDTSMNPDATGSFEIQKMRVGTITKWKPMHVRVDLYNEKTGRREEVTLSKKSVAIVENPFYSIMNERSSTLQRLIRKLNILDAIDEQSGSGKLDLIVQLPYAVKHDLRNNQAEQRRKDIEFQLRGSQYGIAYIDATEKVTQLNRPAENNLLKQVEYLQNMLYTELGLTPEIMNGTADEAAMNNYFTRTIKPVLDAVKEEMLRKFITKTARTQKQTLMYFRDVFELIPLKDLIELANQLSRNEIATANELRPIFGFKPSTDPKADKLINSNINPNVPAPSGLATGDTTNQEGDSQNGS